MLVGYARASISYKKVDEFTKSFDETPLIGRAFDLRIEQRTDEFDSAFTTRYDADKETLDLSVFPSSASVKRDEHDDGPEFDYIPIISSEVISGPIEMENAFGVKREGHVVVGSAIGVGSYGGDRMGVFPIDKIASSKDFTSYNFLEKTIKMPPEKARQVMSNIWMEVSGVVRRPSESDIPVVDCADSIKKATLDYNYEEHWSQCVISAKLKRIAIVSQDGGTLAEWK